jgi:hypothetical protein
MQHKIAHNVVQGVKNILYWDYACKPSLAKQHHIPDWTRNSTGETSQMNTVEENICIAK